MMLLEVKSGLEPIKTNYIINVHNQDIQWDLSSKIQKTSFKRAPQDQIITHQYSIRLKVKPLGSNSDSHSLEIAKWWYRDLETIILIQWRSPNNQDSIWELKLMRCKTAHEYREQELIILILKQYRNHCLSIQWKEDQTIWTLN